MMRSLHLFLLACVALFASTGTQQPAHGARLAHAFTLAQATPQGATKEHGHKADKNKSVHKSETKEHGKSGLVKHKNEQRPVAHIKSVVKVKKQEVKPKATMQKEMHHVQSRKVNKRRTSEKYQRYEHKPNNKIRKNAVAAQKKAPTAGTLQNMHKKVSEQTTHEHEKVNQTRVNVTPPKPKTLRVEQHKRGQSAKPTVKATEQPTHTTPKTVQHTILGSPPMNVATPPPPSKPRNASAFILRQGEKPSQGLNEVRRSRHETREGNRIVISEGDRTIERENNRAIIRHSESDRFAVGARHVNVERHDGRTMTIVIRPNGVRIISTTDQYGHLIRRVRRDPNGREIVIIDDSRFAPWRRDEMFVDIPPPRIHDHNRYVIEAGHADRGRIYEVFTAPPIERLQRYYTVDQVRYSYALREYMPRVDLDIHFDSGSWQLTPDQIDRLGEIAAALNEAIDRNPRELYLIEGYTDAVGSWEDNLSLSDRRAEAVAVALTEVFHVPPENLVTQGYGETYLKVQTQGPSRANRRVAVQRITPLIAQVAIQDQQ